EHKAVRHELASDAAARRAKRKACTDFAGARRSARQKQAGDVQTCEEQEQRGGGEQDPKRLRQRTAKRGVALRRGSEAEDRGEIPAAALRRNRWKTGPVRILFQN